MNKEEIAKQYKIKMVSVEPMLEDMVRQFRNDKHSLDIQQLRLITEYLIEDREFDADYIDETEQELEQLKEKNKELEEKCKEVVCVPEGTCFIAVPKNMISKDKVKEIIEKSFDEMLNHSNKFNCGDMQMLENNIVELLEEV